MRPTKNINKLWDRNLARGDEWFADIRPAVFVLLLLQWANCDFKCRRKDFIKVNR
jgi:hypothetical protein